MCNSAILCEVELVDKVRMGISVQEIYANIPLQRENRTDLLVKNIS